MNQTERYRRLRLLIKKLNKERKRRANQIDILCNDLVAAQREFMLRLDQIGFAAHFYKSLLGAADVRSLLIRAGRLIGEELPAASVVFFLRQADGCEEHICDLESALNPDHVRLEESFTPELVTGVCKANRPCNMDDLFGMGLEGNRKELNSLSAATVPLHDLGRSLGFILLWREAEHPLRADELDQVALVTCGLSQAIRGCGVPLQSRQ